MTAYPEGWNTDYDLTPAVGEVLAAAECGWLQMSIHDAPAPHASPRRARPQQASSLQAQPRREQCAPLF